MAAARLRLRIKVFCHCAGLAWLVLVTTIVNDTLDFMAGAVEKVFTYVAPSISFGLYAGAEALFLYGLYLAFFGPQHGLP